MTYNRHLRESSSPRMQPIDRYSFTVELYQSRISLPVINITPSNFRQVFKNHIVVLDAVRYTGDVRVRRYAHDPRAVTTLTIKGIELISRALKNLR